MSGNLQARLAGLERQTSELLMRLEIERLAKHHGGNRGNSVEVLNHARRLGALIDLVGFDRALEMEAAEHHIPLDEIRRKYDEIRREREA